MDKPGSVDGVAARAAAWLYPAMPTFWPACQA